MVIESGVAVAVPEQGNLVRVRDRFWVVESGPSRRNWVAEREDEKTFRESVVLM